MKYTYKMNITQLPVDILLYIVYTFNSDIFHVHNVNKEFNRLSNPFIEKKKKRALNKHCFLVKKCKRGIDKCWLYNAFHSVTTIEECQFIQEMYVPKFGLQLFIRQIGYTIGDSYQTITELWTEYLNTHKIQPSVPEQSNVL